MSRFEGFHAICNFVSTVLHKYVFCQPKRQMCPAATQSDPGNRTLSGGNADEGEAEKTDMFLASL